MRYDRTALRAAARSAGHKNSRQMSLALGVGEMTGWRLWHGVGGVSASTAERVQVNYHLPVTVLRIPAEQAEARTEVPA
ncbi:hypothetical protein ACWD5R_11275 [Streptomyces sp. NPDC002514]|uniref:hypothetical protein n=1 Tax=unclassified Streptomyces TaxID=2593676 RepID=UPI0036B26B51